MSITHPVFRVFCAGVLAVGGLASPSALAAGTLASNYQGRAHHNSSGGSENIVLQWIGVTPHANGKFAALLEIQNLSETLSGARDPHDVPTTEVPINGKLTNTGKITFSGKISMGQDSLTIKDGKGQLSALGNWILGTLTVQNKNFNQTRSGKYTFDIESHEM
jgi:hypothetical protein